MSGSFKIQYRHFQSFHYSDEDLTAGAAVKSASASSEDVSISRAETTCSTPTKA